MRTCSGTVAFDCINAIGAIPPEFELALESVCDSCLLRIGECVKSQVVQLCSYLYHCMFDFWTLAHVPEGGIRLCGQEKHDRRVAAA